VPGISHPRECHRHQQLSCLLLTLWVDMMMLLLQKEKNIKTSSIIRVR
jgi:hypothetical protein